MRSAPRLVFAIACASCATTASPPSEQALTLTHAGAELAAIIRVPPSAPRPVPAVVLVHGSGRQTADDMLRHTGRRLEMLGLAVVAYDKRGVGKSTGEYTSIGPGNSVEMFDLLAGDALTVVDALRARPDIDTRRIGLVGISQGGWIAPLAASRSAHVSFVVTISGPAVSVGEEIAYSRLAGADPGSEQGLSDDEIDRRMREFTGPHGYDPIVVLTGLRAPSFWVLGDQDRSIPLKKTVAVLQRLAHDEKRPITAHVLPGLDHGLRHVVTGEQPDYWRAIATWLQQQNVLRR
jgi:dipeptidyl aminopeptidase/acylaminoacyl peptidase